MSLYDYKCLQKIKKGKYSFDGIAMALLERADCCYLDDLKKLFPDTYKELMLRNNTVGGKLKGE